MEKSLPAIPAKRYFTIGEVSDLCGVKPYVLRYWEQEFAQLKPMKRRGNRRYYQHHEVLLIRRIRELLYDQGFTISGARNRLADAPAGPGDFVLPDAPSSPEQGAAALRAAEGVFEDAGADAALRTGHPVPAAGPCNDASAGVSPRPGMPGPSLSSSSSAAHPEPGSALAGDSASDGLRAATSRPARTQWGRRVTDLSPQEVEREAVWGAAALPRLASASTPAGPSTGESFDPVGAATRWQAELRAELLFIRRLLDA